MLTLHRVRAVRLTGDGAPLAGHSVVVAGDRIAAGGPVVDLLAEYGERGRVREWDGVLAPGGYEPDAAALLEGAYWPDPREADVLGTEPLTGADLEALDMTDTRWGGSARRGVQRLLASGVTAVSGPFARPAVRQAVERSGVRVMPGPARRELVPDGPADFAVFDDDGVCLVTVLGGRMVHRRR